MNWKPIRTYPGNVVVEVATFPQTSHVSNMTIASSVENLLLACPTATHWRELTPEAVTAALRPVSASA